MATPVTCRVIPAHRNEGLLASPEKRNLVLGLLLVIATLALYNPVTRHPFVNYDDDRYVTDNAHVRAGLHWATMKWAFTTFDEANWHPLTWFSHALDCQLFGLNPAGHHYVNVLLHALNVMLLFWLLWRATGATGCSLMVTALFAVHPINVESVSWVAERKTVLSMLFFLLALWTYGWYARRPGIGRYMTVAALFACGLMAKPMVITLPFVLLLWDFWPLQRIGRAEPASSEVADQSSFYSFSGLVLEKVPLLALSAVSAVVTLKAQHAGDAVGSITEYPIHVRLENAVISYAQYIAKAFWPSHLSPMYPLRESSLQAWQAVAAALFLILVTVLVVTQRQRRYLSMGWLWFLGTLVPMIGLVQVGRQSMADRYAYLPFLGLFVMICWGVADWTERRDRSRTWLAGLSAVCLLALAAVAHRQISYWGNNVTLWSHAVQVTGENFIAEDNLGGALLEQGHIDEAIPHFRAAAAIEPSDPMSQLNIAADEQRRGNLPQAIEQYKRVLDATRDPRFRATAFSDLGYAYRDLGDLAHARESFRAAVSLRPRTLRAWVGLGLIAQKSGDYTGAVNNYSRALAIQPWDLGYLLLARALEQSGRGKESQAAMQQARLLSENFGQLQQVVDGLLAK